MRRATRSQFSKIPNPVILADLRRVGKRNGGQLSSTIYEADGRFAPHTIINRFGSWREACFQAGVLPASVQDRDLAIDGFESKEEVHAARRRRLAQRKRRRCLCCPGEFLSDGPHNRICPTCSRNVEAFDLAAGFEYE